MDTIAISMLTYSCLNFSDMSLFTMGVVTCLQTFNLDVFDPEESRPCG
jgi:hypothetical protein